jgi:hypothetical protein
MAIRIGTAMVLTTETTSRNGLPNVLLSGVDPSTLHASNFALA